MRAAVFFILALVPLASRAAPLFADDLETGTLLKSEAPAGRWDAREVDSTNSLLPTADAAHRGALGLRLTDTDALDADGPEAYLKASVGTLTGTVSWRTWVRVTPLHYGPGTLFFGSLVGGNVDVGGADQIGLLSLDENSARLYVGGFDTLDVYGLAQSAPNTFTDGWHLLEEELHGVGTDAGSRLSFLDGVQVQREDGVNFGREPVVGLSFGEYFAQTRAWTGTVDYDDVRVDNAPQASTLTLVLDAGTVYLGNCYPVSVALKSSLGVDAPAPYGFEAALSTPPTGAFFADPRCMGAALGSVSLGEGDLATTAYVRLDEEGASSLSASYVDFISAPLSLSATHPPLAAADGGGANAGLGKHLGVGCGCSSANVEGLTALAALLGLGLRRRSLRGT